MSLIIVNSETLKYFNINFWYPKKTSFYKRFANIINVTATSYWDLKPKGKFHTVGAVLEPMAIPAFSLIMGEKTVGGSPIGSPELTKTMLDFCVRHNIYPTVEEFPMEKVNEALAHLEEGKARFRIVLKN